MGSESDGAAASGHAAMISRIKNARFKTTRLHAGYDDVEVDSFLEVLVAGLSGEDPLDPELVRGARFPVARWRPGYVRADVEALLDEVQRYADEHR
jgi:DivIVA domain-containing protein